MRKGGCGPTLRAPLFKQIAAASKVAALVCAEVKFWLPAEIPCRRLVALSPSNWNPSWANRLATSSETLEDDGSTIFALPNLPLFALVSILMSGFSTNIP